MVVGQACLYTAAVTGRPRVAAIFAAVLGSLFGFLYVVLRLESLSLLAGALGLFVILSAVMAATRRMGPGRS
jgi:inner membrane protein